MTSNERAIATPVQPAIFWVEAPGVERPKSRPKLPGTVRWARYKAVRPVRCDDCVQVLYEAKGAAPLCRQAKYRRVAESGDRYLCLAHAQQWREDDTLPKLKGPRS